MHLAYGYSKEVSYGFEEAIEKATAALKEQGFGILTTIDVKATLKEKIDVDFPAYTILGACNPNLAHKALTDETEIGLLMPCNVIVYEKEGKTMVAGLLATETLKIADVPAIEPIAQEAEEKVKKALDSL